MDSLQIDKESFIEEDLKEYFSDLLYSVKLAGKIAYIYLLFEHKSYLEKYVSLQLLGYKIKIWQRHVTDNRGSDLPIIVPLFIYHGPQPWLFGNRFSAIVERSKEELVPFVPDFEYILYDLSSYQDYEIKGMVTLRIAWLAMKHIFDHNFLEHLPKILMLFKEIIESDEGTKSLEAFIRYVFSARDDIVPEQLKKMIENNLSKDKGEMVMSLAEKLVQQGFQNGEQQGIKAGIQTGFNLGATQEARAYLIEVLEERFDLVPHSLFDKINQIQDPNVLRSLRKKAKTESLDQFGKAMNQILS